MNTESVDYMTKLITLRIRLTNWVMTINNPENHPAVIKTARLELQSALNLEQNAVKFGIGYFCKGPRNGRWTVNFLFKGEHYVKGSFESRTAAFSHAVSVIAERHLAQSAPSNDRLHVVQISYRQKAVHLGRFKTTVAERVRQRAFRLRDKNDHLSWESMKELLKTSTNYYEGKNL